VTEVVRVVVTVDVPLVDTVDVIVVVAVDDKVVEGEDVSEVVTVDVGVDVIVVVMLDVRVVVTVEVGDVVTVIVSVVVAVVISGHLIARFSLQCWFSKRFVDSTALRTSPFAIYSKFVRVHANEKLSLSPRVIASRVRIVAASPQRSELPA